MRWSGGWRGRGGNEDTGGSTEGRAVRPLGIYGGLGEGRVEMRIRRVQQRGD